MTLTTPKQLYRRNEQLIEKLAVPPKDAEPLHFDTEYPQGYLSQFNQCLWKFLLSYWRDAPCECFVSLRLLPLRL